MSTTGVLQLAPGANYYNGHQTSKFGGKTCHVHVKVENAGHENNRQK